MCCLHKFISKCFTYDIDILYDIVSMKSQFILDSLVLNELKSAFLKSHTNLLNEWVRIWEKIKQANMDLWSLHIGSRTPCSIIDAGEFVNITSSKVLDGSRVGLSITWVKLQLLIKLCKVQFVDKKLSLRSPTK